MIRNDFVSNSSSSSFMLGNSFFIRHFNITAKDFIDAMLHLMPKSMHKYIYMCDPKDKSKKTEKVWKESDDTLKSWIARIKPDDEPYECSKYKKFEDFLEVIRDVYQIYDSELYSAFHNNNKEPVCYNEKVLPRNIFNMFKQIKKHYRIYTMYECAHDPDCIFFCHMGDNDIWTMDGTQLTPAKKAVVNAYTTQEEVDECKKRGYETDSYTFERVLEIIIKYWQSINRIDLDDPKFIEYWEVPEDHWWKKNEKLKNRKYFFNGKKPSMQDIIETFVYAANMHEG